MKKLDKDSNLDEGRHIKKTAIAGLVVIERPFYPDNRGFLQEFFRQNELSEYGINFKPVHGALSYSREGVIRGIHTERWQKLIMPITGKMFGAYPDFRPESPTFGKVVTFIFDNTKDSVARFALLIPPGVGNSICVMGAESVNYFYLNEDYWEPSKAQGILWNDPDLAIDWPIKNPIISERDRNNPTLRELFPNKFKSK